MRFLEESERGRFVGADPVKAVRADKRFRLDDAPVVEVVEQTLGLAWTRDPFDRLLCGHALARGWPIATSDANIIENLTPAEAGTETETETAAVSDAEAAPRP